MKLYLFDASYVAFDRWLIVAAFHEEQAKELIEKFLNNKDICSCKGRLEELVMPTFAQVMIDC